MWTEKELKQEQNLIYKCTKICKQLLVEKEGRGKKRLNLKENKQVKIH